MRIAALLLAVAVCLSPTAANAQSDNAYKPQFDFKKMTQRSTSHDEHSLRAVSDWSKARYGGGLPKDFTKRLLAELENQKKTYPGLVAGAKAPAGVPVWL